MKPALTIPFVDAHASGEPSRVLTASHWLVKGATMAEKFAYARTELDWLRHLVLHEPRGFPALCAVIVTPPCDPRADIGIIVCEQAGFRAMSGSNTMCTVTALLETGALTAIERETTVVVDTAVGLVEVRATVHDGSVTEVSIRNVPAFVHALDFELDVPELGRVRVDIAFGGQFFALVHAADAGIDLETSSAKRIIRAGAQVLLAARDQVEVRHPDQPDIDGVQLVMLHGPSPTPGVDGRNAVVMANGPLRADDPDTWTGALDRSPCGTGTCARMAVLHARGELAIGERFVHESMTGGLFTGRLEGLADSPAGAVRPVIAGRAFVTSSGQLLLDRDDPFQQGLTVGDIWSR